MMHQAPLFFLGWGKRLHAGDIFKPEWASHLNILSLLLESMSFGIVRRNDITNMVDGQSLLFFFVSGTALGRGTISFENMQNVARIIGAKECLVESCLSQGMLEIDSRQGNESCERSNCQTVRYAWLTSPRSPQEIQAMLSTLEPRHRRGFGDGVPATNQPTLGTTVSKTLSEFDAKGHGW